MDEYAQMLLQAARESGLFSLVSEREPDEITAYPLFTLGRNREFDPVAIDMANKKYEGIGRLFVYLIMESTCTYAQLDQLRAAFLTSLLGREGNEFRWALPDRYLICLMFEANNIGPKGAESLAESANMQTLEILFMDTNPIGSGGADALGKSTQLPNLRALHLDSTGLGDEGAVCLANSPQLAHLTKLYLCSNKIGDPGAIALANSPYLKI